MLLIGQQERRVCVCVLKQRFQEMKVFIVIKAAYAINFVDFCQWKRLSFSAVGERYRGYRSSGNGHVRNFRSVREGLSAAGKETEVRDQGAQKNA